MNDARDICNRRGLANVHDDIDGLGSIDDGSPHGALYSIPFELNSPQMLVLMNMVMHCNSI